MEKIHFLEKLNLILTGKTKYSMINQLLKNQKKLFVLEIQEIVQVLIYILKLDKMEVK